MGYKIYESTDAWKYMCWPIRYVFGVPAQWARWVQIFKIDFRATGHGNQFYKLKEQ